MKRQKIEQIGSRRKECRGMYDLLQEYAQEGIRICLDGKEAEPGQVTATCLREGVSYMMDFIPDEHSAQRITKIDFTRIDVSREDTASARREPDGAGRHSGAETPHGWCG